MKPKLIRYSWDHDQNQMVLDPEGGWVLYEPVASRIEALERERDDWKKSSRRMTEWYEHRGKLLEEVNVQAKAARREALEDAASPKFLRPLIEEQSEGEWDDKTIDRDVATFAKAIHALMEKKND
jgi:ferritin